jgi:nitrate/nitrite-specific signal transduction histidine kinase
LGIAINAAMPVTFAPFSAPSYVPVTDVWTQLADKAQWFMDNQPFQCNWSMEVDPQLAMPGPHMSRAVLQIFDAMLDNVVQHAHANRVDIRVRAQDDDITVLVKDDGRGAPPSAFESRNAQGIAGMRECAIQLGGWLDIHSQVGQGTTCILTVPLHPYRPHSTLDVPA